MTGGTRSPDSSVKRQSVAVFYTEDARGLWRARVHHAPYELFDADARVDTTLVSALGLPTHGVRTPDFYSPGVDVEIYPLTRV